MANMGVSHANLSTTPSVGVSSSSSLAIAEPDPRSALLESIRAGKNLKVFISNLYQRLLLLIFIYIAGS